MRKLAWGMAVAWGVAMVGLCGAVPTPVSELFDQASAAFPKTVSVWCGPSYRGFVPTGVPEKISLGKAGEAWRTVYVETAWIEKSISQQSRPLDPDKFDPVRREELFRRLETRVAVWLIPETAEPSSTIKAQIPADTSSPDVPGEIAFLGRGSGYWWYAEAPVGVWISLQKNLKLSSGDDGVAAAVRTLVTPRADAVPWAERFQPFVGDYLSAAGATAFPEMMRVAGLHTETLSEESLYSLYSGIGRIDDPAATAWLLAQTRSSDPRIARRAVGGLMERSRPEAESLYLEGVKREADVGPFLEALRALNSPHLADACREVRSRPLTSDAQALRNYSIALSVPKTTAGWAYPIGLQMAERDVWTGVGEGNAEVLDRGCRTIREWPDGDAAQLAALNLATIIGKGSDWRQVHPVGLRLLSELRARDGEPPVGGAT